MKKLQRTEQVNKYQLPIEIEKSGEFFVAKCPRWDDCYAQGETIDEATSEIIAAAGSLIELYKEEDLHIPLESIKEKSANFDYKFSFTVPVYSTV